MFWPNNLQDWYLTSTKANPIAMLLACLHIPDFPVQSIVRTEENGDEHAIAILDGSPSLLTVLAVDKKARLAGVFPGMTKAQCELFPVKLYR